MCIDYILQLVTTPKRNSEQHMSPESNCSPQSTNMKLKIIQRSFTISCISISRGVLVWLLRGMLIRCVSPEETDSPVKADAFELFEQILVALLPCWVISRQVIESREISATQARCAEYASLGITFRQTFWAAELIGWGRVR